ncbi:MAG: RNA polymerase subunit sigma [Phycisphaerales bacterium]|nr:RNA polymerase subunit sigma [Phycisphaerales bacterium]
MLEVTRIVEHVEQFEHVEQAAAADLLPLVYDELRAIASRAMAQERVGHTLQATALVHEAYARLVGNAELAWDSRAHFFVAAAEAMRRILIEHARSRTRLKRGGPGRRRVPLSVVDLATEDDGREFLSLDAALGRLLERAPEMGEVARLRLFAGLGVDETAMALAISPATVKRRWTYARAWLQREIQGGDGDVEWHDA